MHHPKSFATDVVFVVDETNTCKLISRKNTALSLTLPTSLSLSLSLSHTHTHTHTQNIYRNKYCALTLSFSLSITLFLSLPLSLFHSFSFSPSIPPSAFLPLCPFYHYFPPSLSYTHTHTHTNIHRYKYLLSHSTTEKCDTRSVFKCSKAGLNIVFLLLDWLFNQEERTQFTLILTNSWGGVLSETVIVVGNGINSSSLILGRDCLSFTQSQWPWERHEPLSSSPATCK